MRCVAIAGRKNAVQFLRQFVVPHQQALAFGFDFQPLNFVVQRRYDFALRAAQPAVAAVGERVTDVHDVLPRPSLPRTHRCRMPPRESRLPVL